AGATLMSLRLRWSAQLEHLERQAARQDAQPSGVPRAPWYGAVDENHENPRDPARALAPREAPQHEPGLGVRGGPGLPIALGERDRPRDHAIGSIAVRARAGDVPHTRHLPPAVIVTRAHHQEVAP